MKLGVGRGHQIGKEKMTEMINKKSPLDLQIRT